MSKLQTSGEDVKTTLGTSREDKIPYTLNECIFQALRALEEEGLIMPVGDRHSKGLIFTRKV